jgi:hypothetical protein
MTINVNDLRNAIDILLETEKKMRFTFMGVGRSPYADSLVKLMGEIGLKKEVTIAELMDKFKHDITRQDLENAIDDDSVQIGLEIGFIKTSKT